MHQSVFLCAISSLSFWWWSQTRLWRIDIVAVLSFWYRESNWSGSWKYRCTTSPDLDSINSSSSRMRGCMVLLFCHVFKIYSTVFLACTSTVHIGWRDTACNDFSLITTYFSCPHYCDALCTNKFRYSDHSDNNSWSFSSGHGYIFD